MKRALLFDLDDTLVVEEPAAAAAFLATAQVAAARHRVQADKLALAGCCSIKIADADVRAWYARAAVEHGWSRKVLEAQIASDLRGRQGAALSSFDHALPAADSELVHDAIKDPYNFEFLSLSANAKERDLEAALLNDVQSFLMEMGRGFALLVGPAFLLGALRCLRRPRARFGDQPRPIRLGVDERFTGARQVAEAGDPVLLITRTPLQRRVRRTLHQPADLGSRVTLRRPEHDLGALNYPHLRGAGSHDPFELRSILNADLDALRQSRHTEPPSSLTEPTTSSTNHTTPPSTTHELHGRTTSAGAGRADANVSASSRRITTSGDTQASLEISRIPVV